MGDWPVSTPQRNVTYQGQPVLMIPAEGWLRAKARLGRKKIPRPGRVRRTLVAGRWGTLLAQARAEDFNGSSSLLEHSITKVSLGEAMVQYNLLPERHG
jgi:hypothetical protein